MLLLQVRDHEDLEPFGSNISEYVGEEFDVTDDHRELIVKYTKRNYQFQGQPKGKTATKYSTLIDSAWYGNIARFLNHRPTPDNTSLGQETGPNCDAHPRLVNGDFRIGIFSCMRVICSCSVDDDLTFDITVQEVKSDDPDKELTLDYGKAYWVDGDHSSNAEPLAHINASFSD